MKSRYIKSQGQLNLFFSIVRSLAAPSNGTSLHHFRLRQWRRTFRGTSRANFKYTIGYFQNVPQAIAKLLNGLIKIKCWRLKWRTLQR